MTALPDLVRQTELLNQLVLTRSTMEELGRVEVLWMYPQAHRVLGFVCRAGFLGNRKLAFKLSQVEAIGASGILTHSQPDETDAERVRQLESLIHCEVWSRAGHRLGKVIDCEFKTRSGAIVDYLVVSDRLSELAGSIYRLPPAQILSFGKRVLVEATALQELAAYREGLPEKLSKVSHLFRTEGSQVTQDLRSLAKRAQETTLQTTAQIKTLAEQARERAQTLAEQAKERAQELNEQLREGAETLVEQARETRETLIEQLQDRASEDQNEWPDQRQPARRSEPIAHDRVAVDQDDIDDIDDIAAIFDQDDFENEDAREAEPGSAANADAQLIDDLETVLDAIDDLFGDASLPQTPSSSSSASVPIVPNCPSASASATTSNDDWGLADETPWSQDKIAFRQAVATDMSDRNPDDDDPWNITEPPDPTEIECSPELPRIEPLMPDLNTITPPRSPTPPPTDTAKAAEGSTDADDEPWI